MKIVLVKAAEPDFTWKKSYSSTEYAEAMRIWESLPVAAERIPPAKAAGYHVWAASSLHARQTAELWLRTESGEKAPCDITDLLDDIQFVPFADPGDDRQLPLRKWIRLGRQQWKRGDPRQPESRDESVRKADELIDRLEAEGEDVILISYERRILVILEALRRRKYQIRRGSVFHMEPMERILAARQILTCGRCAHNCQLSHPGCSIGADKARQLRRSQRKSP